MDKNQFFVEAKPMRYIFPFMVTHYIRVHCYKLPDEVEQAIRSSIIRGEP